jgi:hypothetical protein
MGFQSEQLVEYDSEIFGFFGWSYDHILDFDRCLCTMSIIAGVVHQDIFGYLELRSMFFPLYFRFREEFFQVAYIIFI